MEYVHYFSSDGELRHWGIKGQKWGIRRYQNKDGSLTPAGRKRYNPESESSDAPKKKTVKDMTDEEIRTAIARKQLENQYSQLHPEPPAKEGFAKKFINDAIKPAMISSGRKALESFMDKTVKDLLKDKVDPDSYDALKKTHDKLDIKAKIRKLREGEDPDDADLKSLEKLAKRAEYEKKIAESEAAVRKASSPTGNDRTPEDVIRYLSDLDEEGLNRLETAASRAKDYQAIVDLIKKEKDSDKK